MNMIGFVATCRTIADNTRTVGGVTENYAYDDADKLQDVKVGGVAQKSYGYDSAGRTTSVVSGAGTTTLAYDYEGRISQITYPSTATNTFTYNGLDTRVGKVDSAGTSTYKRDGAGVTAPVLGDGGAVYTPGISERRSSTTTFLHSGLKNADSQTGTGQTIGATKQYDAFGNVLSSTGTWKGPFGYAGSFGYQEDADSSLKLLGHRYYDPSTGRFLTRDPVKDGRNWYVYCESNPVGKIDPEGLGDWDLPVQFGGPGYWGSGHLPPLPDDPFPFPQPGKPGNKATPMPGFGPPSPNPTLTPPIGLGGGPDGGISINPSIDRDGDITGTIVKGTGKGDGWEFEAGVGLPQPGGIGAGSIGGKITPVKGGPSFGVGGSFRGGTGPSGNGRLEYPIPGGGKVIIIIRSRPGGTTTQIWIWDVKF